MKKQNIRLIIDVIMTICMLCLMNTDITGLLFHKILGMIILLFVIAHIAINFDDIKKCTFRFCDKTFKTSSKVAYVLNILLGILLLVAIFTGKKLSMITSEDMKMMRILHIVSAILTFIGISIHLGLHWNKVMRSVKSSLKIKGKSKIRTIVLRVVLIIVIIFGSGHGQGNIAQLILQNISKMAVFAAITYYICKFVAKRKQLKK